VGIFGCAFFSEVQDFLHEEFGLLGFGVFPSACEGGFMLGPGVDARDGWEALVAFQHCGEAGFAVSEGGAEGFSYSEGIFEVRLTIKGRRSFSRRFRHGGMKLWGKKTSGKFGVKRCFFVFSLVQSDTFRAVAALFWSAVRFFFSLLFVFLWQGAATCES